jgi:hypothetical protein
LVGLFHHVQIECLSLKVKGPSNCSEGPSLTQEFPCGNFIKAVPALKKRKEFRKQPFQGHLNRE